MHVRPYRMQSGLPTCGTGLRWHVQLIAAIIFFLFPDVVWAQDADNTAATTSAQDADNTAATTSATNTAATASPTRPAILSNRWQEDWSVLADPQVPREPGDSLKYIPFSPYDPKTYLSFGADLRERFEANDAASFGIGPNRNADYLLSRTEAHADLRLGSLVQMFCSALDPSSSSVLPIRAL